MSNNTVAPKANMKRCVYNKSHFAQVGSKYATHLAKCRELCLDPKSAQYDPKAKDILICEYNSQHHVHKDLIEAHYEDSDCVPPYFDYFQDEAYDLLGIDRPKPKLHVEHHLQTLPSLGGDDDEDWGI